MPENLFTPTTLCGSLGRTLSIFSLHFPLFVKISGGVMLLGLVPRLIISAFLQKQIDPEDPTSIFTASAITLIVLILITSYIFASLGSGAITKATADIYARRQPLWNVCIHFALGKLPTLLLSKTVAILGIMVGIILLYVPGLILSLGWSMIEPVIIIGGASGWSSLGKSWNLTSGHRCFIGCTLTLFGLTLTVINLILSSTILGGTDLSTTLSVAGIVLNSILYVILLPLSAILVAVLYFHLRVVKEGLNIEKLLQELDGTPSCEEGKYLEVPTYAQKAAPATKVVDGSEIV